MVGRCAPTVENLVRLMNWLPVIGLACVVFVILLCKWVGNTPEGYQDETGFHLGPHPLNKPSKGADCCGSCGCDDNKPTKGEKV